MAGNQPNTNKLDLLPHVQFTSEEHGDEANTTFLNGVNMPDTSTVWTTEQDVRDEKANLPPVRTLLALSLSFNLVYTAFSGIQNLQSSINQTAGLGLITMAVVYGANPPAAPLGPTVLSKFGCKKLLLASWVSIAMFVGANFYTSFYTLIPAAAIMGVVCSQVSTISVMYTTAVSDSYIASHHLRFNRRHSILSLFNGIFYTFWEATQVTGNLVSSLVLSSSGPETPDDYEIDTSTCGAAMCVDSSANSTAIAQPAQETVYILFGVFLACVVVGFIIAAVFLPPVHIVPPAVKQTVYQGCVSCYKMLLDRRCVLLVPLFLAQAAMMMFIFTGFTKAYISCTLGVSWVGFIMMVYGTSTAICATAINSLSRCLDRKVLITAFILIDSSILLTLLLWNPSQENSKTILFCIAAVAGISQGISQAQFNALLSTVFKDNLIPAFVAYIMTKNLAASVSLAASNFACMYHRLYATLILYVAGFACYLATEISIFRRSFTKAYISCTLGVSWVGFIMMVYGTSTAICATAINSLSRCLDRKVLITAFILIDSSILLTLLLWNPSQENSKTILFCIAAVAGISQGISQAQFNALLSTVFKDNLIPAFVAYIMTKNLAASVSLAASNFACMYHRLYATLILYVAGFACYLATEISIFRRSKMTTIA